MDEAAVTRRATLDAVEDVEPAGLLARIEEQIERGSMVPGALTIVSVQALDGRSVATLTDEDDTLLDPVARRAAGVQLIYDGLRLTRSLSHDQPWVDGDKAEGNLDVLVADVLVARGFHLLSRTEAADCAVEMVRAFGRDQTVRRETDDPTQDWNLEADALELAVVAGASLGDSGLSPQVTQFATEKADEFDDTTAGFPTPGAFFTEHTLDRISALGTDTGGGSVTTSVDD